MIDKLETAGAGIVIIAVHCHLMPSLRPDPSLPTRNICM